MAAGTHPVEIARVQRLALAVGVLGAIGCAVGAIREPSQFVHSYLFGYLPFLGIALGSLAILQLHHLSGGAWGLVIRRILESGTQTLPLLALLFVPIVLGVRDLYLWAQPEAVAADELLRHKSVYLNVPFFVVRAVAYFASWVGIAWVLNRWSALPEAGGLPPPRRFRLLAGPGLAVYGLTITFASVDWAMSLDPHWFSTIYGLTFGVGQVLAAFAFAILVAILLGREAPLARLVTPERLNDLGNFLLTFVMLWAYLAYSQYLLIWAGNVRDEIPWYLERQQGGWTRVAQVLIVGHFAVPFFLLLLRDVKRSGLRLGLVCVAILGMRFVDLFWILVPAYHRAGAQIHWLDVATPIGIGGLWLATFLRHLQRRSLLPLNEVALAEALGNGRD